jgi:hypothetical protein
MNFYEFFFYFVDVFSIESLSRSRRKIRTKNNTLTLKNLRRNDLISHRDSSVNQLESRIFKSNRNLLLLKENLQKKKCESKTYWDTNLFLSWAFCTRDIVYTTIKHRNATTFNAIRKFVVVLVNEFIFILFFNNESSNERFIKLRLNNVSTTRSFRSSRKSEKNDDIAKRHRNARDKKNEIACRDRNKNKKIIDYSTLLMIFHLSQKISTMLFFFSKKLIKIWKFISCRRFFCDDDNKFDHKNWNSNRKRICNNINDENIRWFNERRN